jgi:hypothetical protein
MAWSSRSRHDLRRVLGTTGCSADNNDARTTGDPTICIDERRALDAGREIGHDDLGFAQSALR